MLKSQELAIEINKLPSRAEPLDRDSGGRPPGPCRASREDGEARGLAEAPRRGLGVRGDPYRWCVWRRRCRAPGAPERHGQGRPGGARWGAHQPARPDGRKRRGRGTSSLGIAWGLPGDSIPLAMLTEYRTAAAPADGGGVQGFVGYRFPASVGEFANVQRPRVAPGTAVFPSITSASVANRPAEGDESADSDPTLRGEHAHPQACPGQHQDFG